ncbi:hypothetical protein BUALT_Bualt02G0214800 [Buddleja alternifolia]|uniref:JmjC domain-containing protein n=1 Tax=Buddleja alternifolia TaxID=168488 RepID=A0AAV6Y3K1_9LAMI|nr:hypothetical protein BUALT_Bualt02G0214800 [Buddleja alternifolia]
MAESLQIRRLHEIPSAEEFASQIEQKNVPVVFSGCVKHWKAFTKWNVSNGGLDYLQILLVAILRGVWGAYKLLLQDVLLGAYKLSLKSKFIVLGSADDVFITKSMELVGSSVVEAMLSKAAPVFNGDIRSHERVPLPFSTFIGYCKDLLQYGDDVRDSISQLNKHKPEGLDTQHGDSVTVEEAPEQIYLAQVPIVNAENEEKTQLECLREDIEKPAFLEGKILAAVNLWMNNARTRSSTHYDPHHNLLCIISGYKQVILWPPSACPSLYPLPLYGEASNHSAIALENPDFSHYPRAKSIDEYSQKVILHAGDALFIPEGWYHQVDSESLTIAINFWWQSDMMSGMLEHMDAYYLRRILKSADLYVEDRREFGFQSTLLLEALVEPYFTVFLLNFTLLLIQSEDSCDSDMDLNHETDSVKGKKLEQRFILNELEPHTLQTLHELVTLIHARVNQSQPVGNTSADQSVAGTEDEIKKRIKSNLFNLKEDPIAHIIWTLEPHTFQNVFLAMAHNFPRTLEAFILHALSPVGIEVLTRKFEQMDQTIVTEDRSQFYQKFYSVFDNQSSAMDALLNGKESFAREAFKNVLVQYLGINFDGPKPSVE